MANEFVIGIDLGTTYSCVAVYKNGKPQVIPNGAGSNTIPSYVAYENAGFITGTEAKDNASSNPKNTIFAVKRIIGRRFEDPEVARNQKRWPFDIVNAGGFPAVQLAYDGEVITFRPEDISAEILKSLKQNADDFLGTPVKKAVITVPASFTDAQKKATRLAGQKAGLDVIGIINEPTAAAVAYGVQNRAKGSNKNTILVFDFGGGTLDVTILQAKGENEFRTLTTQGNMQFGGEDFDQRLMDKLVADFEREHGRGLSQNISALARVRREAERGKRTLSSVQRSSFAIHSLHNKKPLNTVLTREQFEEVCSDLYPKVLVPIKEALRTANLQPKDIHQVVPVGGSSKMPKIQEMLMNFFSREQIYRDIDMDEAIAKGAAVFAYSQTDADGLMEINIQDVIPNTLGIELHDKSMLALLRKDTPYPAQVNEKVCTAVENQSSAVFKVYEGEDVAVAGRNKLWGTLVLTNIRKAKAGEVSFTITFKYDVSGLLQVTVTEDGNNKNKADIEIRI